MAEEKIDKGKSMKTLVLLCCFFSLVGGVGGPEEWSEETPEILALCAGPSRYL